MTNPNPEVQALLDKVEILTPTNIHLVTNASEAMCDSFRSVWFRHTHSAARLMLLPYFNDGRISLINELPSSNA